MNAPPVHRHDCSDQAIAPWLREAARREASDIHIVPGYPVTYRVHGRLEPVGEAVDADTTRTVLQPILPPRFGTDLERHKNVDFSVSVEHEGRSVRFRVNVYLAQNQWCAALRQIPGEIPTFEWMGFPETLAERLVRYPNGLVIITGITGSGKSTSLAALVDLLNRWGGYRIITVEQPIEYIHPRIGSSLITQREVGRDVDSFYDGLTSGLRQDPDVILVGEIRDRETARIALSAAETGHLILTTLHTRDAKGAITRFVDLFPHDAQDDVRTQLALSLRSVISQHLLPPADGTGKRVLAMEILHVNHAVRAAIKFGKVESIESAVQTGKRDGMRTLDEDLERLLALGKITRETARRVAKDPGGLVTA